MTDPIDAVAILRSFDRKLDEQFRQLRPDLTEERKAEALRIGRIEFKSAGATRKR